jgi:class 3 adenylate cyclase/tetratricopeptide (TPR) repeat protein
MIGSAMWSAAMDVGGWLRKLGLEQYQEQFRKNKIDADVLSQLTADDLKAIGVSAVGDRRKLLAAIGALARAPPADTLACQPVPASQKASSRSVERRPITVMFCDLVGSTNLASRLDAEDWHNLVSAYLEEASAAVTGLGGYVLKKLGDGLMALFGYPQAQENDAERAVRAALAIQRGLVELNARNAAKGAPQLHARIGLGSGQVVVDETGEVFGEAPNVAARVQTLAEPGAIIVTAGVQRQVAGLFVMEDKGTHELKGVPEPVALYRIVRASGGGRRGGARTLTPLVGRTEELESLTQYWERSRGGEGQLVLVVGEPGIGKSRLLEEFRARLGETPHTWVEWSSSQLLQNTPLHPIAEWGRLRFGAELPPEQRLADLEDTLRLIGLDPQKNAPLLAPLVDIPLPPGRVSTIAPEELRQRQLAAIVAWVLAGARSQPVVLAFEDLHWADPTSLDLMTALSESGAEAPLFILATARPEFRLPWSIRSYHRMISLAPLNYAEVARMVGQLALRHALSKDIIEGVMERTGGVPLFVEEVTHLLLERSERGGAHTIPPTLQQSLAARLDRLGSARETAQIGAVLGRDFAYALLRDVAEMDERSLQTSLDRLSAADILFVEGAPPQATYRFKHTLIRDAAYESLLKARRKQLHRRVAEILRDEPDRPRAEPEIIAHHFTEAGLDEVAIDWWGKAGKQALRRSAFKEAIAHLRKAIEMTDNAQVQGTTHDDNRRVKLQADYALALAWSSGYGVEGARDAVIQARKLAAGPGHRSERQVSSYNQWTGLLYRGELRKGREVAEEFLADASSEGDDEGQAVAQSMLGLTHYFTGNFVLGGNHLEQATRVRNVSSDIERQFRFGVDTETCAGVYLALVLWILGEVERSSATMEKAIRRAVESGHAPTLVNARHFESRLPTYCEDFARVLRKAEGQIELCQRHGVAFYLDLSELLWGWAYGRSVDANAGLVRLRTALAKLENVGYAIAIPLYRGLLADVESAVDPRGSAILEIDRAIELAERGETHAERSFLHRLRGEILLRDDRSDKARAANAFNTAITIAREQGARSFELLASLSLAKLYESIARPADARAILAAVLEGFAPTPDFPQVAEAQALLAEMARASTPSSD